MSYKHEILQKRLKIDEFVDNPNLMMLIRSTGIESTPSEIFQFLERVDKVALTGVKMRDDRNTV
jgi:hypothetical protein